MNNFSLKTILISLFLLSNTVSLGMITIANLPKPQHKKNPSPEFKARQSAGFKKFQERLKDDRNKQLLITPAPLFDKLPLEIQNSIVRLMHYHDAHSLSLTSHTYYNVVKKYKTLNKEYLCAISEKNSELANEIKEANPNLPFCYIFPMDRVYNHIPLGHSDNNWSEEPKFVVVNPGEKKIKNVINLNGRPLKNLDFDNSYGITILLHKEDVLWLKYCLMGDADNTISKRLQSIHRKPHNNYKDQLLCSAQLAINEGHYSVARELLNANPNLWRNYIITHTLLVFKRTNNKEAFNFFISTLPLFLVKPQTSHYANLSSTEASMRDFMTWRKNTFTEDDIALVHARAQELLIERKQADQHCIIL